MSLRFIHSADWHLDRPFKGLSHLPENIKSRIQDSTFKAMDQIIRIAIDEQVDFVIIAGDLFDQNHRSLRAQMRVKLAFTKLQQHGISVYLSHGNHDPLNDPSVQLDFPDNVHVFSPTVEHVTHKTKTGTSVHLYGFSYPNRHVTEDMTPFYEKVQGADIHIGILHGSIKGNPDHDNYAPFILESLVAKQFDYWALGHIHKRSELKHAHPFVGYSGNIQGLSSKETGEKGILLVNWQSGQTEVHFKGTADLLWHQHDMDVSECMDMQSLLNELEHFKAELRKAEKTIFLRLVLKGSGPLCEKLTEPHVMDELLELLRDSENEEEEFIWVTSIESQMTPAWDREELLEQSSFIGEVLKMSDMLDNESLKKTYSSVYNHPRAAKHLEHLTNESIDKIRTDAEQYLIHHLYPIQKGGHSYDED